VNNYATILLITALLLALVKFTTTAAQATPKLSRAKLKQEQVLKRKRRAKTTKRTFRKNFQVKKTKKAKKRIKIHKNPKKPLTKRPKCNKVCQYHKLRVLMLLEAANDFTDSHNKGFKKRTKIKKRKK